MASADLQIINKLGLHARAAAKLSALCASFSSRIVFSRGSQSADGKSIMSLMLLAAGQGTVLHVECTGDDAQAALTAVATLFANRFDEAE